MLQKNGQVFSGFKKAFILFFLTCLVFSVKVHAQDPNNPGIPNLPNVSNLPTTYTKAQLDAMLKENGQSQKSGLGIDKTGALKNRIIDRDSLIRETTPQSANTTDDTYGMHLFRGGAVAAVSELSTPPLDYPIGVYDQIIVSLWGGAEATFDYTVARDGSIFPTGLGKIYLQGLTFENVRSLIIQRFRSVVPGGTNITVSLGQPRTITVNVAGEVNTQGPVTVSAFTNAFNIIAVSGGPTDLANLREILIKRNGKVIDELDVYKYLTTGDFGKHIYMENNDFVIIQTVAKKVKAEGKFKRPMYYQLKKDEGIKALLKYSGGLTKDAFSTGVKVYRTDMEKQTIKDVNVTAIINPTNADVLRKVDFPLEDGDIVKVIPVNPGLVNKVEVKGEISYPGQYEIRKGDKLFDIINRAGGITRNTYLPRAYIFRGGGDSTNIKANKLEVNLNDIAKNDTTSLNNVELIANDQILLFNNNEFGDKQYVEIFGEVRKPGKINKYGGMTLQDLLFLSGGLKQSAEYGRIEISSVLDIDSAKQEQKPTRVLIRQLKILPELDLDSVSARIELKPYDQVYVRKNPTFELQQLIQVNGLVKYPGPYPRLDKYERLSSYIERAGGVVDNADLAGAILYRKKIQYFRDNVVGKTSGNNLNDVTGGNNNGEDYNGAKAKVKTDSLGGLVIDSVKREVTEPLQEPVSIELYKALQYKNSKYDIIMQEGDIIFIPEINPFVNVKGTVQSALKLTFDKEHTNVGYYIDKAGGYSKRPWRSRIYVLYANGKSRRTKNIFFLHFYPKVEEGSTVVVPYRPEGKEVTDAVQQVLFSSVPIITGIILSKVIK